MCVLGSHTFSYAVCIGIKYYFIFFLQILNFILQNMSGRIRPHKISYMSIPGDSPLLQSTVGDLVEEAALKFGDSEAAIFAKNNERLTFADIHKLTTKLAAGLLHSGLNPGDRVAIWGTNTCKWYLMYLAIAKAGMISVLLNPLGSRQEIFANINKVGTKCLVIGESSEATDYYTALESVVPEILTSRLGELASEFFPTLSSVITMEDSSRSRCVLTYNDIYDYGGFPSGRIRLQEIAGTIQFDDVYSFQFTSDSSAAPKAAMLSHHSVVNNSFLVGKRQEAKKEDKLCVIVPFFRPFGSVSLILTAFHYGFASVFLEPVSSGAEIAESVSIEKCTILICSTTMNDSIMEAISRNNLDVSSLRAVVNRTTTAADSFELDRSRCIQETTKAVRKVVYGFAETSPAMTLSLLDDDHELVTTTIGYPLEHMEVKVIDDQGHIVPLGTTGELCFRGFSVMQGYYNEPVETRRIVDAANWFHTGDLVKLTASGHLKYVGKINEIIISNNVKLNAKEIEEFLYQHPLIREVHVFGVPDLVLGEVVAAWIAGANGGVTEQEIIQYCEGKIAWLKIPRYIKFIEQFPKSLHGNIQKFVMRDAMIQELRL